ncbi:ABC transporter permease [Enterococcus sp. 669A]|uniref:ABC transporter permease n=1 Tax=Candidatus Enterococcus moelleringii TaxID=2815325 RepID=A0ABS3L6B9_9ENTE|nr:ABC transporter permease [Enterococcus sp. 669A]MBO1305170.1 ABC transporter permease [Enterococcus sp. 669A]
MRIIIKHAWLNLKRNTGNDLLIGLLFFFFLMGFFFLLQVYTATDYSLAELKKQTDTIVKIEPDYQADKHAANLKEADYQALKQLPYVKKSHLSGYAAVVIDNLDPANFLETQGTITYSDSTIVSSADDARTGLTVLDDVSLDKFFGEGAGDELEGTLPLEQGTCLVTKEFAEAYHLKLEDVLTIGDKKLKIVGIVDSAEESQQEIFGGLFVNLATFEYLDEAAEESFLTLTLQLNQSKHVADLRQDLKQMSAFNNYQLQSGQLFIQGFETFSNRNEFWLNGTLVGGLVTLFLMGAGYWPLFKQRRSDTYALRLMGIRPKYLVSSNLLEVSLIAMISWFLAIAAASFFSGAVVQKWMDRLAQASGEHFPLLDLKQAVINKAQLHQLVLASSEAKLMLGVYLASFLLLITILTNRLLYVFGHYSFRLGRYSKK